MLQKVHCLCLMEGMSGTLRLDLPTLLLSDLLIALLLASISLWLAHSRTSFRAMLVWGDSLLILAAALVLTALRGHVPEAVSPGMANVIFLLSSVFMLRAVRKFNAQSTSDWFGWILVLASIPIQLYFSQTPSPSMRVIFASGMLAIMLFRAAYSIQKSDTASGKISLGFLSTVFWLYGGFQLVRVAIFVSFRLDSMQPGTLQQMTLIATMFFIIGATVGLLWLQMDRLQTDLKRLALMDPLTGVLNRRGFIAECDREISRCRRKKESFALALFNLDHFQALNDTYGYLAGDAALIHVVFIMRQVLRSHDILARIGGEEFVILLPGVSGETAATIAQRLLDGIASTAVEFERWTITLTASCGISIYPQNGDNWSTLLTAANHALYEAKGAGRNRVVSSTE